MRKIATLTAAVLGSLFLLSSTRVHAQFFDAGVDLRIAELAGAGTGEPTLPVNGVWTYGTSNVANAGAAFVQFPTTWHGDALPGAPFFCGVSAAFEGWRQNPDPEADLAPLLVVNATGVSQSGLCAGIGSFDPDTFWVHPDNAETFSPLEYVVLRWTAPSAGTIDITADWVKKVARGDGVSTHVRHNGVLIGTDGITTGGIETRTSPK